MKYMSMQYFEHKKSTTKNQYKLTKYVIPWQRFIENKNFTYASS